MATIKSIQFGDQKFDFDTSALEKRVSELEALNQHIYFRGYYKPIPEIIEELCKMIEQVEHDLYSNIADIHILMSELRPETIEQIEKPKQKFDLEIFEVIEAENPFLLNLI